MEAIELGGTIMIILAMGFAIWAHLYYKKVEH